MGKTIHLPLPLPKDAFHPGTAGDGAVLFLGRLEQRKGIHILLEAARLAPRVKIILAGHVEEPLKSQLPHLLPPNVVYAGFQSGPALLQLQHESSAMVFPSIWYENQPMSILEMFALGKPVIASDLGGMRELIGAEERGKLVPAGDAHALAESLIWITDHPQDARRMGENAYQYASKYHSPESHYERIMRIYAEVRKIL
jgi:glycosyltransferase involved in cell wall biosynthesis